MLRGKTEPRIWTPPLRPLTPETTLGYDVIEFATEQLNVELLPWEEWLFIHGLEIVGDFSGDWHLRFRTVIVLVARQNGKSVMGMVLAAFFLAALGAALVLGTAQDLDQAEEVWEGCVQYFEDCEDLADEVQQIYRGNGSHELRLKGYRRYKVAAATRKGGRGKTSPLVLMDELREPTRWDSWSAVSKTIKAKRSALVWCMSNAGDASSVVLRHLRLQAHRALGDPDGIVAALDGMLGEPDTDDDAKEAMEALSSAIGLFEWSAAPGRGIWDREGWRESNPSLGYGFLDESTIAAEAATDPEATFRTEDLCQFIETSVSSPFPSGSWERSADEKSEVAPDSPVAFAVDVAADRKHAAIGVAGMRADRTYHVELAEYLQGTSWVQGWFERLADPAHPITIALQGTGAPASDLAEYLKAIDGIEVYEAKPREVAAWCGRLYDCVRARAKNGEDQSDATPAWHRSQPALDMAAAMAVARPAGDAFAWDRRKSAVDVSPLVAVSEALGLLTDAPQEETRSAYEEDDLLIL